MIVVVVVVAAAAAVIVVTVVVSSPGLLSAYQSPAPGIIIFVFVTSSCTS